MTDAVHLSILMAMQAGDGEDGHPEELEPISFMPAVQNLGFRAGVAFSRFARMMLDYVRHPKLFLGPPSHSS